jgi:hypothetical protein
MDKNLKARVAYELNGIKGSVDCGNARKFIVDESPRG